MWRGIHHLDRTVVGSMHSLTHQVTRQVRCKEDHSTTRGEILETTIFLASLAQPVEHVTFNHRVAGSNPAGGFVVGSDAKMTPNPIPYSNTIGSFRSCSSEITTSPSTEYIQVMSAYTHRWRSWSNAGGLSPSLFGGAGSNPARCIVSLAEWSNAVGLGPALFGGAGSNPARHIMAWSSQV
jgi:hypothetical protein